MRASSLILAGVAVALAGATAVAAEHANMHVLTVLLPDGRVEQVRYAGDIAPRIVLRPVATAALPDPDALLAAAFGGGSPFAEMDRLAAAMAQQSAAMMRQVATMSAQPAQAAAAPRMVTMAGAPAGLVYRSVVSTTVNGKTCTTTMQSVSPGQGKAPQLLRQVSGDCAIARPTGPVPAAAPVPPAPTATLSPVSAPKTLKPPVAPDSI